MTRLAILGSGNGTNAQQITEYFAGRTDVEVACIIYNVRDAYIAQLEKILDANGEIDYVQVHTVRRIPAEKGVSALPRQRLEDIANRITAQTGLKTSVYI